jgi:NAD(P)H dehydrogenase (quinone)
MVGEFWRIHHRQYRIYLSGGIKTMSHTVVVYHSGYGHTRKQAEAVAKGAAGIAGASAELVEINAEGQLAEGAWEKLDAADAIVFGTPTYMGGPSWQFKRFADASSKAWFTRSGRTRSPPASPIRPR